MSNWLKQSKQQLSVLLTTLCLSVGLLFPQLAVANPDSPQLANYFLNELQSSQSFIDDISRHDLLILTPAQMATKQNVIRRIRAKNPDIIMLAYVPSQSYNVRYWTQDPVFRHMRINERWWLDDPQGNHTFITDDLLVTNMSDDWISYLLDFTQDRVLSIDNVDGIFFDMVSENISWLNNGDIDVEGNGRRTSAQVADRYWLQQSVSLLQRAQRELDTTYIVTNGSSHPDMQPYINGRMFETFPTPWEANGDWGAIMNNLKRNKTANINPQITILNGNTYNTGNNRNYRHVRYTVGSGLLEDAYISYDYGDQNHGHLWWYDEYNVDLGGGTTAPRSLTGRDTYGPDLWRRDFDRGAVLVNSADRRIAVDLGGEFEKLRGTQDPIVNDGRIVSDVSLAGSDGLILLKTTDVIDETLFENGAFVRFFRPDGSRVRNGFFSFDDRYAGGVTVIRKDLNFDGRDDVLTVTNNNKLEARRHDGQLFLRVFPYTAGYRGTMQVAVEDIDNDGVMDIIVAPSEGYREPIKVYSVYGTKRRGNWFPFGPQYDRGYDIGIILQESNRFVRNRLAVTKRDEADPRIMIYDHKYFFQRSFSVPAALFGRQISVAGGDLTGDGNGEVAVGAAPGYAPRIGAYDFNGNALFAPFEAYTTLSRPGITVEVSDIDFDGRLDIIGQSDAI